MNSREPTYTLSAYSKMRYNVGPYNNITKTPRYTYEIDASPIRAGLVTADVVLMGGGGEACMYIIEAENKSDLAAFIYVKRDGKLLTRSQVM